MMFRVRTIFFPRNPYLFGDMTWGLMYVLHGLAGVGLIALVMMHIYFGLRPEKQPITKSMIFGWMDRDFYLEDMIPTVGRLRHLRYHNQVGWDDEGCTMLAEISNRCDAVEECYEFLLAYAAQGLPSDQAANQGAQVREFPAERC